MESVYLKLYGMVKKCEERYDKKSKEFLAINIHCNSPLKRYKDWVGGTSDVAMEISQDALNTFMTIVFLLKDLEIIPNDDAYDMARIAMDEHERLMKLRFEDNKEAI